VLRRPDGADESVVNLLQRPVISPFCEIVVHGAFGQKVVRKHVSLASASALVEDRVEHRAHVDASTAPAFAALEILGDQFANDLPLLIGQVAGVPLSFTAVHRTLHCFEDRKMWR
jgi:hypothetical protein